MLLTDAFFRRHGHRFGTLRAGRREFRRSERDRLLAKHDEGREENAQVQGEGRKSRETDEKGAEIGEETEGKACEIAARQGLNAVRSPRYS